MHRAPWNEYRHRMRWFIGTWLGVPVAFAALNALFSHYHAGDWAMPISAGLLLLAFAIATARIQQFPCPRCGETFFCGRFGFWPFARSCRHCDHPKWAN
jgi:hypothetical protein